MQKQIVRNESMRTVIRYAFWLLSLFLMSEIQAVTPQKAPLKLGAERMDVVTRLLKDKQVGLVVNQTSILEKQQKHLLDALLEEGINIKKVFAPEHGFRGTADAGAEIKDSRDVKTGVPIISLYGKNKKPTAEQLAGLDVVVFDIQDVGVRFYTYISTMHYVMEACAENDVEFIVLDRPNPNDFVDGPVRQKEFESFVGVDPLPILHGLTVGELAWMINKEGWLKSTPDTCKLHIVKMENWRHGDPYWLPVKPLPTCRTTSRSVSTLHSVSSKGPISVSVAGPIIHSRYWEHPMPDTEISPLRPPPCQVSTRNRCIRTRNATAQT